ncbi:MAG TPA: 30S ribosomal protein S20 [Clostridiales bacterium]|nr:30S ribosomal protein S20 [Clostridiales bacterium]
MANIKSAIKRIKTSRKSNLRNRMLISSMRTAIKRVKAARESGDAEALKAAYIAAVSKADKAASKGAIHKNAANRRKAQLAKMLNAQ